jgi:alpha-1,3-glucan synthase
MWPHSARKVEDVKCTPGELAEPVEVIFGEPCLIQADITYVIFDHPVFRAQTKADPCIDDLSSAIFYSIWNYANATTICWRPTVDIYDINDYRGSLAPISLLPKILPTCLSLRNAEFQGLWLLGTKEAMKEIH